MTAALRILLRQFERALAESDPGVIEWRRLEAERRRIQRENGFNERGEPLRSRL